jgi:hypothetical protein
MTPNDADERRQVWLGMTPADDGEGYRRTSGVHPPGPA